MNLSSYSVRDRQQASGKFGHVATESVKFPANPDHFFSQINPDLVVSSDRTQQTARATQPGAIGEKVCKLQDAMSTA